MANSNETVFLLGENEYCRKLSEYLRDYINQKYKEKQEKNPSLPSGLIVRNTRNYDAVNVPLSEFPLLKVYRLRDKFKRAGTTTDPTDAAITYSVAYPDLDKLPDLLYWIGKQINLGLHSYQRSNNDLLPPAQDNRDYTVEYLLTANEQSQVVFPFLRVQIQFKDMQCDC
jgi:hypothetical protein